MVSIANLFCGMLLCFVGCCFVGCGMSDVVDTLKVQLAEPKEEAPWSDLGLDRFSVVTQGR